MLSIRLICVGKLREQFYVDAFAEYSKRLSAYCKFECIELNETKLGASPSDKEIAAALDKEAGDIERAIGKDAYVIAMCVEGRQLKSEDFARRINELAVSGGHAPWHERNDLSAPSCTGYARRANLPQLQNPRRIEIS